MKLNAWLRQNPGFPKRLQVVERLAQALNAVHDRGEPLAALDPEHVEIDGDGDCDISPARRGNPAPGYCAPERAEGGPPSPEADIYAAGAIAWEVLSGRPYAAAPSHLAEAAREVPRELADAVMACLEQSPQWRPRDLTYIAQLAQHNLGTSPRDQGGSRASVRTTGRPPSSRSAAPRSARISSRSGRSASPIRTTPLHEPRSHAMLAVVAAVVVTAAGAGYYWMTREKSQAPSAPLTTLAPAALSVTARPEEPAATPPPVTVASAPTTLAAPPATLVPRETPAPAPTTLAAAAPVPTPTPLAPPVTMARALPPPTTQPAVTSIPRATPPPAVVAAPPTTTTLAAAPALPREPPVLSAVSPPTVRRPGKFLLDLRGTGFRSDLRVRIVPLKEAPHGITVMRQAFKNATLFQVLIDIDAQVTPGGYAITLADASGGQTAALTLTVTK